MLLLFAFASNSHDGLALGWDTPLYVGFIPYIQNHGVVGFAYSRGFYNIGYSILASIVNLAVNNPQLTETVFPAVTAAGLAAAISRLAKVGSFSTGRGILTAMFAVSWLAEFRLASDLHPALLGMLLFAIILTVWVGPDALSRPKYSVIIALLIALSFVHVETAIYSGLVLTSSSLFLVGKPVSSRKILHAFTRYILPMWMSLVPGIVSLYYRLNIFTSRSPSLLSSISPIPFAEWTHSIFLLMPLVLLGIMSLLISLKKDHTDRYVSSVLFWSLSSVAIALLSYQIPTARIFGERSLVIFPTPIAASHGSFYAWTWLNNHARVPKIPFKAVGILALVALSVFATSENFSYASRFLQPFISHDAYERLNWVKNNLNATQRTIFVYDSLDQFAGPLADHYENLVQALYGEHFAYLGNLDLLRMGVETPFTFPSSITFSKLFFDEMTRNGVLPITVGSSQIVIISDFFLGGTMPQYYKPFMDEVHPGVFVYDSRLAPSNKTTYPAFFDLRGSEGAWYGISRSWSQTGMVLEYYGSTPQPSAYVQFLTPVAEPGAYNLTLSLDVGPAGALQVYVDNVLSHTFDFGQLGGISNATFTFSLESPGVHTLRFVPFFEPPYMFVDIDYFSMSLLQSPLN